MAGAAPDTPTEAAPALDEVHLRARGRGVSRRLYAFVRVLLVPFLRGWFRLDVTGAEHVPADGAAILAPNHKSFLDPFFVGVALRRPVRFMAKAELLRGPLGGLLVRLGAFPVRRGAADAEALATARELLRRGEVVVVFPEGTRVDEADVLGSPHHGAGRLALETGAPIVPTAIAGTSRLWLGPIPKPRRVRIAFLPPIAVADAGAARDALTDLIDREVWPAVQREYGRLAATPGPIIAALAALGIGGGLVARRMSRPARVPRVVGRVDPRKVRRRRGRERVLGRLRIRRRPRVPERLRIRRR